MEANIGGLVEEYIPYVVSILTALISGAASVYIASKRASSELRALEQRGMQDIERLVHQHEVDIDSMEKAHQLELETMKAQHQLELESMERQVANEAGSQIMVGLFSQLLSNPEMQRILMNQMKDNSGK